MEELETVLGWHLKRLDKKEMTKRWLEGLLPSKIDLQEPSWSLLGYQTYANVIRKHILISIRHFSMLTMKVNQTRIVG